MSAAFWSKVDQSAGPDGCWPWLGPVMALGYGRFFNGTKYEPAARVAFRLDRNIDPGNHTVRPSCGFRLCVNPAHLSSVADGDGRKKRCGACGVEKSATEFYERESGELLSECKPCAVARGSAWKKANLDKQRPKQAERSRRSRRNTPIEELILKDVRGRARKRGLDFDLTLEDIVVPDRCPVLGTPLRSLRGTGRKRGLMNWDAPSLDRIDNTKSYVKGNVIVVSMRVNRIKHDATISELQKIAAFYAELAR